MHKHPYKQGPAGTLATCKGAPVPRCCITLRHPRIMPFYPLGFATMRNYMSSILERFDQRTELGDVDAMRLAPKLYERSLRIGCVEPHAQACERIW